MLVASMPEISISKKPMNNNLAFCLLIGSSLIAANTPAAERSVINIGTRPESITQGFGGHYYVTVMGEHQPGDAVIKVIQNGQVKVFAAGFDEPKGIAFAGGYLVTTDLKQVWKIDAQGAKSILAAETDFPKPVFYLNDIATAPDSQSVYVTDMGAYDKMMNPNGLLWPLESAEAKALPALGRIYQITLDGQVHLVVDTTANMPCPNGLCAPGKDTLLVAEFFHGQLLEIQSGKLKMLNSGFRGADGIEQAKTGHIYVSSWTQGKVWKLDKNGRNPGILLQGLQSAADFFLDETAGQLLVPDMKAGTITILPLE